LACAGFFFLAIGNILAFVLFHSLTFPQKLVSKWNNVCYANYLAIAPFSHLNFTSLLYFKNFLIKNNNSSGILVFHYFSEKVVDSPRRWYPFRRTCQYRVKDKIWISIL
jgi:hypothetical protein